MNDVMNQVMKLQGSFTAEDEAERRKAWEERDKQRAAESEKMRAESLKRESERAVAALGLPVKDLEMLAGEVQETDAVKALADVKGIFVLSGGPGCGKTSAASIWLHRWVTDATLWDTKSSLHPRFKDGVGVFTSGAKLSRWSRYSSEAMDKLFECRRLVVDDLGAEYLDEKGAYISLLDELVNERYANRRATVFTTNLNAASFKARYGERIADRLREAGKFVAVDAPSMRRKA